ncbi:AcrR family transcriptional regulator [Variovorax sp. OAS795]|uniref:TetR/AcrR family transcriptional regulator n=1 Tax=Variovorax sp. OAS795 TaxID=3034231 RepID=UPI003393983C
MRDLQPRFLTREQSQEQTRQRLVESARRLVALRGLYAASVRDIAADAGYSQGAFYSNFASKEALLLEVLKLHKDDEARRVAAIIDSAGDVEEALSSLETWAERLSASPEHALLSSELLMHAVRNADFGVAYSSLMSEQRRLYAALARRMFALSGAIPPAPLEDIAAGLTAMERGLALDRAVGLTTGASVLPAFFRTVFQNTFDAGAQSGGTDPHHPTQNSNGS